MTVKYFYKIQEMIATMNHHNLYWDEISNHYQRFYQLVLKYLFSVMETLIMKYLYPDT